MRTFAFIVLGFVIACVVGAIRGFSTRVPKTADLTPTPIAVFARDVGEGEAVTADAVRIVDVPATYLTESNLRAADWERMKGRTITFPALTGDAVTWQHFARVDRMRATQACALALHEGVEAAASARITNELESMQIAQLSLEAPPPPPPGDTVRVVGLAKDLHAGDELTVASLRIVDVPRAFVTESQVLEREQGAVLGAKVVSEILENDMLTWSLLRRDSVVGTNTCFAQLSNAAHEARLEFAKKAVTTFEVGGKP
jgi:Flp pilus assembly protein CpaB